MAKSVSTIALVAVTSVFAIASAAAQEAAPPAAPVQEAQPVAAPVPSCTGLGCLFGGAAQPSPQPQAAAAPPPGATVAQTTPPGDPAAGKPVVEPEPPPVTQKPKPKPVHPVTIAVAPTEAARLHGLAALMPRGKVKIVSVDAAAADFSVTTVLDEHSRGEKARLFTEQMHIVAGNGVHEIADLRDKVVSFGPEKSVSQLAARKAFESLGIAVKETPLDLDNALDGLATGDLAAVVVLAPQPVARLAKLTTSGLHLVAWPKDGPLPAGTSATTIDSASYPGLGKVDGPVKAVGVDAVLKMSPKAAHEATSRAFLTILAQHSAALSRRGFDLLRADLAARAGRRFASEDSR